MDVPKCIAVCIMDQCCESHNVASEHGVKCHICHVVMNSEAQMIQHEAGSKHKAMVSLSIPSASLTWHQCAAFLRSQKESPIIAQKVSSSTKRATITESIESSPRSEVSSPAEPVPSEILDMFYRDQLWFATKSDAGTLPNVMLPLTSLSQRNLCTRSACPSFSTKMRTMRNCTTSSIKYNKPPIGWTCKILDLPWFHLTKISALQRRSFKLSKRVHGGLYDMADV